VNSDGSFYVPSATLTQAGGSLVNNGTVQVASGTFTFGGGTTSHNEVLLTNSTLNDNTSGAGLFALRNNDTLATANPDGQGNIDIASGQVVDVQDFCTGVGSLTASKGIDVSGTLATSNGGTCGGYNTAISAPTINVLSGGLLLAGPAASSGRSGTRSISGVVNNSGTFTVGDGGGVTFVNSGSGLNQASGGTLGVTVNASSGVSGISGGTNTLAGTLTVNTIGSPTSGSTYQAIAGAADTGTFSTVPASGYTVTYSPSAVTLTAS
jgi:hypothetical protein